MRGLIQADSRIFEPRHLRLGCGPGDWDDVEFDSPLYAPKQLLAKVADAHRYLMRSFSFSRTVCRARHLLKLNFCERRAARHSS